MIVQQASWQTALSLPGVLGKALKLFDVVQDVICSSYFSRPGHEMIFSIACHSQVGAMASSARGEALVIKCSPDQVALRG
jgi:hypothetical protein